MKIKILVAPLVRHPPRRRQVPHYELWLPPLGAGCLTAFLRKHGYIVHLEDLSIRLEFKNYFVPLSFDNIKIQEQITGYLIHGIPNKKIDYFAEKMFQYISKNKCDLIGFSIISRLGLPCSLLLAKKIKEKIDATIVFGGPIMTEYAEYRKLNRIDEILKRYQFIDYIIFGEGGVPLVKLLEYLQGFVEIDDVPNLVYRNKERVIINQRKFFDIEDMPLPDFDDLPLDTYRAPPSQRGKKIASLMPNNLMLPYQITRGCSQKCSFCNFYLVDPKLAMKSHQKVITELTQLKEKYKTNHFFFCESRINISYQYLEELCEIMIENKLDILWQTTAGITNINRNLLMKMRKAGCYSLTWGIESGSDRILKAMNKGFCASDAAKVLRDSHFAGIHNNVNFIIGFPTEREEDIEQDIKFIKENAVFIDNVRQFAFALPHYTPICDYPEKFGIENIFIDQKSYLGFTRLGFDEIYGLKWKFKLKQNERTYKRLKLEVEKIFAKSVTGNNKYI